jgi:pimeloyl-ACP methyl ester carboxylesterase
MNDTTHTDPRSDPRSNPPFTSPLTSPFESPAGSLIGSGPRLSYRTSGPAGAAPLVCLHGLSAESTSWAPVADRFAPRWRTYALDFRGHGASEHAPGEYALADYVADADRLLQHVGAPAVVIGHSLGAVVAAALAQDAHPLVSAIVLEDPPLYVVEPAAFAEHTLARVFIVLDEHVRRLQRDGAPVDRYRDLLASVPHPAGGTHGDHLHDDALWSRASALAAMDPDTIGATLDGTTFGGYDADRPITCPALVLQADPRYDVAFRPEDERRLLRVAPHADVVTIDDAGHNIRGGRASRERFLDVVGVFLARQSQRLTTMSG